MRMAVFLPLWLVACPANAGPPGKAARRTEAIAEAQRLIAALSSMPKLSRAKVEKLLVVKLQPAPDAQGDPTLWEAPLPAGPFAKVRLREPGPKQKFGARLSLDARAGNQLPKRGFDSAWIGPIVDINPQIPPEGTVAHKPQSADTGTVLEFWAKSDQLRQVTFSRDPRPAKR